MAPSSCTQTSAARSASLATRPSAALPLAVTTANKKVSVMKFFKNFYLSFLQVDVGIRQRGSAVQVRLSRRNTEGLLRLLAVILVHYVIDQDPGLTGRRIKTDCALLFTSR